MQNLADYLKDFKFNGGCKFFWLYCGFAENAQIEVENNRFKLITPYNVSKFLFLVLTPPQSTLKKVDFLEKAINCISKSLHWSGYCVIPYKDYIEVVKKAPLKTQQDLDSVDIQPLLFAFAVRSQITQLTDFLSQLPAKIKYTDFTSDFLSKSATALTRQIKDTIYPVEDFEVWLKVDRMLFDYFYTLMSSTDLHDALTDVCNILEKEELIYFKESDSNGLYTGIYTKDLNSFLVALKRLKRCAVCGQWFLNRRSPNDICPRFGCWRKAGRLLEEVKDKDITSPNGILNYINSKKRLKKVFDAKRLADNLANKVNKRITPQ